MSSGLSPPAAPRVAVSRATRLALSGELMSQLSAAPSFSGRRVVLACASRLPSEVPLIFGSLTGLQTGRPGLPAFLGQHDRRVAENDDPGRRDRSACELERKQPW